MSVIEVEIGYGRAPGKFRVEVVRSPAGEAFAETGLDADVLLEGRLQFQRTLLVSAVSARQILSPAERVVRKVGQALFAALLGTEEVAGRYRASAAVADQRGEELRIVLRIDAPELAGLPWEAMYDQEAGGYVCRHHQLVRHVPVAAVPPPLEVRLPLRILGVISAPRGLAALDTDREREQLMRALAGLDGQGLAEVTWAPPTWAGLHELLLAGPWHVLHFIGHGDFDPDRDEGMLALTREDGRADLVEASRFTDLLRQARPMPRLVVLNSCSGAASGLWDLFSGTAAALARSGVAAVAAMQHAISDPAAIAFASGFYAALAHGWGVDEAVSAGRIAILGTSGQTLEWVTPVLYLRGHGARLFTLPPAGAVRPAPNSSALPGAPSGGPTARSRIPPDVQSDRNTLDQAAQKDPKAVRNDRARATRLLTDAERVAQSISVESFKASALAGIARAVAATDPGRAARLIADAERVARFIPDEFHKDYALVGIVEALAITDPDRAERIAQSISVEAYKHNALVGIVGALEATDPDRAERIAQSFSDEYGKAILLAGIARAVAATDPGRAARLIAAAEPAARSMPTQAEAAILAGIVGVLAATDPDRAERIAQSISVESLKTRALARIVGALAATDPGRAERIAQSITNESLHTSALADIARAMADIDPDHAARLIDEAERIAQSITNQSEKVRILVRIAVT